MCLNTWFSNGSTALEGCESFRRWGFPGEGRSAVQPVPLTCSLLLTVGTVCLTPLPPCVLCRDGLCSPTVNQSEPSLKMLLVKYLVTAMRNKSLYSRCYLKDTGNQTKISQERPSCHVFSMGCYDWQQGLEMSVWCVLRVPSCWRHMLPSTGKDVTLIYAWSQGCR